MKSTTRLGQFVSVITSATAIVCATSGVAAQTPAQTPPTQTPSTPPQPQPSQPRPTPPSGTPQNPTGSGGSTKGNPGSQGTSGNQGTKTTAGANSAANERFLKMAAQDGKAEIELADTAASQSQNAEVKALADKIKNDHTKANEELQTLASSKQVTLPNEPTAAQKSTQQLLAKLSGTAFDRAYVSAMVKDHQTAVSEFTKQSKSGDPDVKAFAEKTLPALQDHLQRAQTLQKQLAGNGNGTNAADKSTGTKTTKGTGTGRGGGQ